MGTIQLYQFTSKSTPVGADEVYIADSANSFVQARTTIAQILANNSSVGNLVCVASNGSDVTGTGSPIAPFASIGHALSTITTSSSTNPYVVSIGPGTYSETGLKIPVWVFLVGSMQQPTKIIDSSGAISINSASYSSGSQRLGFQDLNLINSTGITIDFQAIGGSGSNDIYMNNCQVVGNVIMRGRGSDYLTGNSNQIFGTYTSSAMQEIWFGGYFANTVTFNTAGVTGQTIGPEFTGTDLFGNTTFTSSGSGNTMVPTLIASQVSGSLTVDQATTTLYADDVSLNAQGGLSQTNGGLIVYLSVAQYEGYTPATSGNWSPVPTQVAGALDTLAETNYIFSGITPTANNIIYGNGTKFVGKGLTGGRVIYVDANGNDTTGDGSILFPFATIYKANSTITGNTDSNRWIVSIGSGIFNESQNILLLPFVGYIGRGYEESIITSPNNVVGADPSFSGLSGIARTALFSLRLGGTTGINFNLNSVGGTGTCLLELADTSISGDLIYQGRASGPDYMHAYTSIVLGNTHISNTGNGYIYGIICNGNLTIDTANNSGNTVFNVISSAFVGNTSITSSGSATNTTGINATLSQGTTSISASGTTVNIDAVSLPQLSSNYSTSGSPTVNFITSDYGISASYTPTNYTPTASTVDGNFQGIDSALSSVIGPFSAGSVIFSNGTKLTQDNANFNWNDSNYTLSVTQPSSLATLESVLVVTSDPSGSHGHGNHIQIAGNPNGGGTIFRTGAVANDSWIQMTGGGYNCTGGGTIYVNGNAATESGAEGCVQTTFGLSTSSFQMYDYTQNTLLFQLNNSGVLQLPLLTTYSVLATDGSHNITPVSSSTAGYVLTSNGSGSAPTFQAASSGGGVTWTVVTSSTALVKSNGYFANSASQITFTLPATASVGDTFYVANMNTGGFVIAQNSGQTIRYGNTTTTTGTGGSITSSTSGDGFTIVCNVTNTGFQVVNGSIGSNLSVV